MFFKKKKEVKKSNLDKVKEFEQNQELKERYDLFGHYVDFFKENIRFKMKDVVMIPLNVFVEQNHDFTYFGYQFETKLRFNHNGDFSIYGGNERIYGIFDFHKLDKDYLIELSNHKQEMILEYFSIAKNKIWLGEVTW